MRSAMNESRRFHCLLLWGGHSPFCPSPSWRGVFLCAQHCSNWMRAACMIQCRHEFRRFSIRTAASFSALPSAPTLSVGAACVRGVVVCADSAAANLSVAALTQTARVPPSLGGAFCLLWCGTRCSASAADLATRCLLGRNPCDKAFGGCFVRAAP